MMRPMHVPAADVAAQVAELEALSLAAEGGDDEAIDAIRKLLVANPHLQAYLGDVNRHFEEAALKRLFPDQLHVREACRMQASQLRRQLMPPGASVATQVTVCSLVASRMLWHCAAIECSRDPRSVDRVKTLSEHQRAFCAAQKLYRESLAFDQRVRDKEQQSW